MSQRTVKMFPVKGNLWPISSKADRGALPVPDQACPKLERALRTTFTTVDGQPIQVIAATLTMKLPIVQLGELSEAEREGEVRRLATEEAQKPFDLSQ